MKSESLRFEFAGLHGRAAACGIERISLTDGRIVVIATELSDNPGVSVTNFAEELATLVSKKFGIDPDRLVWIEHYPAEPCPVCDGTGKRQGMRCRACDGRGLRREAPTFDCVAFLVLRSGNDWNFDDPVWRPMRQSDWVELGLDPR